MSILPCFMVGMAWDSHYLILSSESNSLFFIVLSLWILSCSSDKLHFCYAGFVDRWFLLGLRKDIERITFFFRFVSWFTRTHRFLSDPMRAQKTFWFDVQFESISFLCPFSDFDILLSYHGWHGVRFELNKSNLQETMETPKRAQRPNKKKAKFSLFS